jgi:hypothetical protein
LPSLTVELRVPQHGTNWGGYVQFARFTLEAIHFLWGGTGAVEDVKVDIREVSNELFITYTENFTKRSNRDEAAKYLSRALKYTMGGNRNFRMWKDGRFYTGERRYSHGWVQHPTTPSFGGWW